jgi:preprotein translocase subunit SecG
MLSVLLVIVHVIVCVALILIVLLQTGKGADIGAAFGAGSSQTLFGSTGASTFLSKATTVAAIVFMVTSMGLAYSYSNRSGTTSSVVVGGQAVPAAQTAPDGTAPAAPVEAAAPAAAPTGAATPTPQPETPKAQ